MDWNLILTAVISLCSAALVAVFNNWDKINKSKKHVNEMYELMKELQESTRLTDMKVQNLSEQIDNISSAQRASLQTHILENCKLIQAAIDDGDMDYEEELKQLIILYREYYLCEYNSQGRLYFNDTLEKAAEDNNTLVHELMATYFSEYDPH